MSKLAQKPPFQEAPAAEAAANPWDSAPTDNSADWLAALAQLARDRGANLPSISKDARP